MSKWHVYDGEKAPQCCNCGMWAPFARYRRKTGVNARYLTNYCPDCGAKMVSCDRCINCEEADEKGHWKDNGICFACRDRTWTERELEK